MRALDSIGRGIDRVMGVFSPRAELTRIEARYRIQNVRKQEQKIRSVHSSRYAAAKSGRLTGDWLPVNTDVNALIRGAAPTIRARTRQLVRDFPYFAHAVNILTNYTVGVGVQFQSRVKTKAGKLDKRTIQQIEDAVKWWMDEASADGKLHYFELERLAKRQEVENGEYLLVKKTLPKDKARGRFIPFALQPYEADWLTNLYTKPEDGNLVDQGIEYDTDTGQVVAYHFMVPDGFNPQLTGSTKTVRVPAEDVVHGFETQRPSQLRGISPFTTAILIAHDLHDYIGAEIDGAKLAAKYLAIVETPDFAGFQDPRTTDGTGEDTGKKIEEMENAIIEYLRPGEKINLASHNRPGDAFTPFTKFVLRMVAVATGTTYELLTSDYSGINYSSLRGIRNDFAKMMSPHVKRHVYHYSRPTIFSAIDAMVMHGKLKLRNYHLNPRYFWESVFIGPGMESIDPLREGKADIEQIAAGLKSPQEIITKRGRDFGEVMEEIKEAKKMMEDAGLEWPRAKGTGGGLQQNPAKMGASENDQS